MKIEIDSIKDASQAMEVLASKGVLPTHLSSREAREQLAAAIRRRAIWSARTTHAGYVQSLRDAVADLLAGGKDNDFASVRLRLKNLLAELQYTPEKGFPGDAALGIPEAKPGSLRDLSSTKRIELVLKTQIALHRNSALKSRGNTPIRTRLYPAWELIRVESRRQPRGSDGSASIGWQRRWMAANGPILPSGRLVALKSDPVWARLGDSAIFDDAMDVDIPPFAFGSGMGWREVSAGEAEGMGLKPDGGDRKPEAGDLKPEKTLPRPVSSVRGLDDPVMQSLLAKVKAERTAKPDHIRMQEDMDAALEQSRKEYLAR